MASCFPWIFTSWIILPWLFGYLESGYLVPCLTSCHVYVLFFFMIFLAFSLFHVFCLWLYFQSGLNKHLCSFTALWSAHTVRNTHPTLQVCSTSMKMFVNVKLSGHLCNREKAQKINVFQENANVAGDSNPPTLHYTRDIPLQSSNLLLNVQFYHKWASKENKREQRDRPRRWANVFLL